MYQHVIRLPRLMTPGSRVQPNRIKDLMGVLVNKHVGFSENLKREYTSCFNPRNTSYKCPILDFFRHFRTKNSARFKNTQNGQETAWVGAKCQIMLGKFVGSEKKVVVPKLQKVEVFGQLQ